MYVRVALPQPWVSYLANLFQKAFCAVVDVLEDSYKCINSTSEFALESSGNPPEPYFIEKGKVVEVLDYVAISEHQYFI